MTDPEVSIGDYILRLDGTVIELLHNTGLHHRWHVNHVAVEAKPRGDGLRLTIGVDVSGRVVGSGGVDVSADRRQAVMDLFAEARRRRNG